VATTAIVAEILISGLQALVWIGFLLVDVFGRNWVHVGGLDRWIPLVTIAVIALAYMLGVLVDRISDTVYDELRPRLTDVLGKDYLRDDARKKERRLERERRRGTPEERRSDREPDVAVSHARLVVMAQAGEMTKFLEYQRSRIRVARSTAFNVVGIIPTAAVFAAYREGATSTVRGIVLFGVGVLLGLLFLLMTLLALVRIDQAYLRRLEEALQIAEGLPETGSG
jgi:hypothetical protein